MLTHGHGDQRAKAGAPARLAQLGLGVRTHLDPGDRPIAFNPAERATHTFRIREGAVEHRQALGAVAVDFEERRVHIDAGQLEWFESWAGHGAAHADQQSIGGCPIDGRGRTVKALGAVLTDDVARAVRGGSKLLIGLAVKDANRRSGARDREELAPADTHAANCTPESLRSFASNRRFATSGRHANLPDQDDSARSVSSHTVMSLDPAWLLLSMIPSGIGFVLFVYGKKQQRWPQLIAGLVFMVYPYFTPTTPTLLGVGGLLGAGLWAAVRMGW